MSKQLGKVVLPPKVFQLVAMWPCSQTSPKCKRNTCPSSFLSSPLAFSLVACGMPSAHIHDQPIHLEDSRKIIKRRAREHIRWFFVVGRVAAWPKALDCYLMGILG